MRMDIWQQIHYREKMYKRMLGAHNVKTMELHTPDEAMKAANEMLRKKMEPYICIADKAPDKEDGYKPKAESKYNE